MKIKIDLTNSEDAKGVIRLWLPYKENVLSGKFSEDKYEYLVNTKTAELMIEAQRYDRELLEVAGKKPQQAVGMLENGHIKIFERFLEKNKPKGGG